MNNTLSLSLRCVSTPLAILPLAFATALCVPAADFTIDHAAKVEHDFAGERVPQWSGGALVAFSSNKTASPVLLTFDDRGNETRSVALTIPGSETIDLWDIARNHDGTLAVCGSIFDHAGKGSGFFAVVDPAGDQVLAVRLYPYYPSLITFASDGTVWTAGLEVINGKDTGPGIDPQDGVVRHFDHSGKQIGSYIPRSTLASSHFASAIMTQTGRLQSANGRVGWYTGPFVGPGSEYYEILSGGTVRKHPAIDLDKWEQVTGLALTDDGNTYVTTFNPSSHASRLLSTSPLDQQWKAETFPGQPGKFVSLYGGDGQRLVFWNLDRLKMTFAAVSR